MKEGELEVDGRRVKVSTLHRVMFPTPGTTKGELLQYYIEIAPVMLAHLRDRQLHMHRSGGGRGPEVLAEGMS